MEQIIQTPRISGPSSPSPVFGRLTTLPAPCRKSQNLARYATALQGRGQHGRSQACNLDRLTPHGTGVINEDRHGTVAELRVLLLLVRAIKTGIDDYTVQPGGVNQPFLQI